jgi:sterol 14-demethylase
VRVDRGLCQGHAVCVSEAPELFSLEAGAKSVALVRDDVPAELRAKLELAVKHCPTHALSLEERHDEKD